MRRSLSVQVIQLKLWLLLQPLLPKKILFFIRCLGSVFFPPKTITIQEVQTQLKFVLDQYGNKTVLKNTHNNTQTCNICKIINTSHQPTASLAAMATLSPIVWQGPNHHPFEVVTHQLSCHFEANHVHFCPKCYLPEK